MLALLDLFEVAEIQHAENEIYVESTVDDFISEYHGEIHEVGLPLDSQSTYIDIADMVEVLYPPDRDVCWDFDFLPSQIVPTVKGGGGVVRCPVESSYETMLLAIDVCEQFDSASLQPIDACDIITAGDLPDGLVQVPWFAIES